MKDPTLIGMLVPSYKKQYHYLKRYSPFQDEYHIKLVVFTPDNINWDEGYIECLYRENEKWKNGHFPFPKSVINRCPSDYDQVIQRIENYIGKGRCFHTIAKFNKWDVYTKLSNSDLSNHLPDTFTFNISNLRDQLNKYKCLFLKPCYGAGGRGIYKIKLDDNGRKLIYYQNAMPIYEDMDDDSFYNKIKEIIGNGRYIVQSELNLMTNGNSHIDMRVMVQKNLQGIWTVTMTVMRTSVPNFFVTNVCRKVDTVEDVLTQLGKNKNEIQQILDTTYDVCLKIAEYLGDSFGSLGELGIDIGIGQDHHIWIIEANSCPSVEILQALGDDEKVKNVLKATIEYASYLASENPSYGETSG
jgi:hypothetical protein